MPERGVLDAGPVIHCGELGIEAVWRCWRRLVIPAAVNAELAKGDAALRLPRQARIAEVRQGRAPDAWRELSPADRCMLWLARENDAHVLTDDLEVRVAAEAAGLHAVGTLGLLVLAARQGHIQIPAALAVIDGLRTESTLYASDRVVAYARQALEGLTAAPP